MQSKLLKSQKGLTLIQLVIVIIVLMLLTGVSTYVALSGNDNTSKPVNNTSNEVVEENS